MLEALQAVDGTALRRWMADGIVALVTRCADINRLNVFPVADSDTGTNLLFTMRAAAAEAALLGVDAATGTVAEALARGAVTGARGNSGVILSQVLRGVAEAARGGPLDVGALRGALNTASVLAAEAVSIPVEGTIVTVLRHAAAAADARPAGADLADVLCAAADGAVDALARTPDQLVDLRRAGVVDAGGFGLVVILDALVGVVTGTAPDRTGLALDAEPHPDLDPSPTLACPGGTGAQDFEVMYLLTDTDAERIARLRSRLDALGDSAIVVGDGTRTWSVHVHCCDPGAAVEAGFAAGTAHDIRISCFALDDLRRSAASTPPRAVRRCILAVVAGDGSADLFATEGAEVLRADDPVTPEALLAAIRALGSAEVLVLPNGALPAQELVTVGVAARDHNRSVLLLPTSSTVQGLAALAVHDGGRAAADDAFAMSEAAAATRWGSVRVAAERSLTLMGTCEAGDGLGMIGHEVVVIAADPAEAGCRLLDQVLGVGGELVTLLLGAQVPDGLADRLVGHVARRHPGVEVLVYPGGQADDLVQVGVE